MNHALVFKISNTVVTCFHIVCRLSVPRSAWTLQQLATCCIWQLFHWLEVSLPVPHGKLSLPNTGTSPQVHAPLVDKLRHYLRHLATSCPDDKLSASACMQVGGQCAVDDLCRPCGRVALSETRASGHPTRYAHPGILNPPTPYERCNKPSAHLRCHQRQQVILLKRLRTWVVVTIYLHQ